MAARLSTAQVDRLGERLRASDQISETDLISLQGFRAEHEEALVEVQLGVEHALPGIDQTARVKTIQTLHVHGLEEVAADQNFGVDSGSAPEGFSRVELDDARRAMRGVLAELAEFLERGVAL